MNQIYLFKMNKHFIRSKRINSCIACIDEDCELLTKH